MNPYFSFLAGVFLTCIGIMSISASRVLDKAKEEPIPMAATFSIHGHHYVVLVVGNDVTIMHDPDCDCQTELPMKEIN